MDLSLFEPILSILLSISAILTTIYAVWQMRRTASSVHDLIPSLDDYIFQEDGEWQMDERLSKIFEVIGSRMALSMRQSLFQGMGVQKKIQKGLQKAVIGDVVDSKLGPLAGLGGILGINVKGYLEKNPGAIQYLLPLAQSFMEKNSPGRNSDLSHEGIGYG